MATIIALCASIGLHWLALQSVAWATMIVDYSKRAPLRQAISQTFDGAHPCSLCHAVNAGKKSEKKSEFQSPTGRIDMICPARQVRLPRPFVFVEYPTINYSLSEIRRSPPVPPPRVCA